VCALPIRLAAAADAAADAAVVLFIHLMISLPLHATVLEPDLDLAFSQLDKVRYLEATTSRQVSAEVKLLLELQSLRPTVCGSQPLALVLCIEFQQLLLLLMMMMRWRMIIMILIADMLRRFVAA